MTCTHRNYLLIHIITNMLIEPVLEIEAQYKLVIDLLYNSNTA